MDHFHSYDAMLVSLCLLWLGSSEKALHETVSDAPRCAANALGASGPVSGKASRPQRDEP